MLQITNALNENCSLEKKIIFVKIQISLDSKNDSELQKFQFLTAFTQKVLQDIKKSFEYAHLNKKNLLNFT